MSRILIIDDELSMREMLEIFFIGEGYEVETAEDGLMGINKLSEGEFDLIITDLRMPKTHGLVVLERAQMLYPNTPVLVMTAYASTETAVKAMKMGAEDYFTKPFQLDEVKAVVAKALEKRRLILENRSLRRELNDRNRTGDMIGRSPKMQVLFKLIHRIASTKTNVLILGESGTGKELVARAIHDLSERKHKPFLVINCAAIPEQLLESELFGHKRGTFTGATHDREGLFQAAHGGSLLLDEIGEMPLSMQVKLLRVLEGRKIKIVGEHREIPVDVRVIAATNRDLKAEVKAGRFREDLFYRLNVISLELPPLRERPTDIPLLVHHFLRRYAHEFGKDLSEIEPDAMQALLGYDFSGNVRELGNIIERAVALEESGRVRRQSLPPFLQASSSVATPAPEAPALEIPEAGINLEGVVDDLERRLIGEALKRTDGHKKEAAKLLGISFRSLRYRLTKLNIEGSSDP
ncbi:sigma-54 dependent transcriptional regulator [Myxococcota bacterium]|nr:sigma-54 dependent transcriptional regulator [Myxococcota bacterium]MBU1432618.1 sigma-54 dependent transcriptional regulator [Myxococcota bacterium]MBU1899519.1 sigma-54 dependent transcriptional regulator [Myxococcota bacterium]